MKKTLLSVLCLAAAGISMTSCQSDDEQLSNDQAQNNGLTLVAELPGVTNATRTELSFDENGMPVPLWGDCFDIENEDYCEDYLYASFPGNTMQIRFYRNTMEPAKTTSFTELKYNPDRGIKEVLEESNSNEVYFVKNAAAEYYNMLSFGFEDFDELNGALLGFTSKPNTFASFDDVLVSKPVAAQDIINNTDNKPLSLQFKRLTGIIRINLMPDEGIDLTNGGTDLIRTIQLSTNGENLEGENPDFGGPFRINLEKGELESLSEHQYSASVQVGDMNVPTLKTGEGGYPAYISVVPMSLKQGDKLTLVCFFDNRTMMIVREITVPAGGIDIKAGEITTFNIKISRENIIL